MKLLKKKFSLVLLTAGSFFLSHSAFISKPVAAQSLPNCPSDASAYADKAAFGSSFSSGCRGTPSSYGITVYKMGFCTSDPLAGGAGVAADYSSCTITFSNSAGSEVSFAAGQTLSLPASSTSFPTAGTYGYAIIELSPTFEVADSIGPFADGITYYSTATLSSGNSVTSTSSGAEVAASLPMTTFTSGQCDAAGSASVTGATLTGALLNSSGELIADNSGISQCAGVSKLLGVANLSTSLTISAATKALKATFTVENNGSTIFCSDGSCSNILVGSGPFNVAFTVVE